jgi:hypothetical protein
MNLGPDIRFAGICSATTIGAMGLAVGLLTAFSCGSAYASEPMPFATASGLCSTNEVSFPAQATSHPDAVMHFQSVASAGSIGSDLWSGPNANFGVGDAGWAPFNGDVEGGTAPLLDIGCPSGSVEASLAERPGTPASFSGVTTAGHRSWLPFKSPGAGQYMLTLTLDQGELEIEGVRGILESSGEYALGALAAGDKDLLVEALSGPAATWTASVRELPVVINKLSFAQTCMAPGTGLPARFAVTGDTTMTATVTSASGQVVRSLGTFNVSEGESSLAWDGRGEGGATLPTGAYALTLVSTDPQGESTSALAPIYVTGSGPSVAMTSPATITPSQSVAFALTDTRCGVASAQASIDGEVAGSYIGERVVGDELVEGFGGGSPPSNGALVLAPRSAWKAGTHRWTVDATDSVGNMTTATGTFAVASSVAKPKSSSVTTPACTKQAAMTAARNSSLPSRLAAQYPGGRVSFTKGDFFAAALICHSLIGKGVATMAVTYGCCTAASPTPLAVFEAVDGKWRLVYLLVNRLVYDIKLQGNAIVEKTPVYSRADPLCCPSHYRIYRLRWSGHRFMTTAMGFVGA